ncbi:MAG: hypothetical protein WCV59_01630 [Parcubacteria group bacterium]
MYEIRKAAANRYDNPQENFDRGVEAMITAYKELGHMDYVAIIGEGSLPNIVTHSQCFFSDEVEEKFLAAGIEVEVKAIAATSDQFWSKEIVEPLLNDAGLTNTNQFEFKTCSISRGKTYRYHFDIFNYDKYVSVYKLTRK